jgi:alkylated DNA nucleotide flippase Atl1
MLYLRSWNYHFKESNMSTSDYVSFLRRGSQALGGLVEAMEELAVALERGEAAPVAVGHEEVFALPEARGPKQQQLVDLMLGVDEKGIKTGDLAKAVDMDQPNAYLALQALTKQGLVELVPGVQPQHWRLAARYRLSRKIIDAANSLKAGEWTTYGDISQVVYGHARAGLAVGRVMSSSPDVKYAHRVLGAGGWIPDMWRSDEGLGRDECVRRLREEGVEVSDDYFAHGRHAVGHEEIAKRLA